MVLRTSFLAALVSLLSASPSAASGPPAYPPWPHGPPGHAPGHAPFEVIKRDVCIIGGGSSGTYSAIRLQQLGKTVSLIEREDRLGGHVNTFVDTATGATFDYGVIVFEPIPVVFNYFKHLNVSLSPEGFGGGGVSVDVDFANSEVVSPSALAAGNLTAAIIGYEEQLAKYPYLLSGFNLPDPVPEDLLIPFGAFLDKYDLGALAFTFYTFFQGIGNMLAQPTLYMIKYAWQGALTGLSAGYLTTTNHDNQQLYNQALAQLGSNALLSSNVTHVNRAENGVEVFVETPEGTKLIQASKLLIAIPPKLSNLGFLDLDQHESQIFGQFNNSYYWDAVVRNTGIPDNTSLSNVDPKAPFGIPPLPGIYGIGATGFPNLHTAYFSSPSFMSNEAVQDEIRATNDRLVKALGFPPSNATLEFAGFNNHQPFELTVSVDAIKNGFYGELEGLQGERNTWYTGAAWQTQDSSSIWNFTEFTILPQLVK